MCTLLYIISFIQSKNVTNRNNKSLNLYLFIIASTVEHKTYFIIEIYLIWFPSIESMCSGIFLVSKEKQVESIIILVLSCKTLYFIHFKSSKFDESFHL